MHAIIQEERSLLGRLLLPIIIAELSCWQQGVPVIEIRANEILKNGFARGYDCHVQSAHRSEGDKR